MGICDRLVPADRLRDAAIELAEEIATSAPLAVRSIRTTMRRALREQAEAATANERAELRALEAEAAAFRKDAVLAGRRAIPDVTARLGYTRDTFTVSGDNENTLSLSASIPLPFFDHGQHDRTAALARAEARDENRKSLAVASRAETTMTAMPFPANSLTSSMPSRSGRPRSTSTARGFAFAVRCTASRPFEAVAAR